MKALLTWMAIALGAYGAAAGAYHAHLSNDPKRVLVVVDSSHDMRSHWSQVDGVLDDISSRRYAQFSLFTEKSRVHGWSGRFKPGRMTPYAPRSFGQLERLRGEPEFAEADEIVLVTNAPESETDGLSGMSILRIGR